MTHNTLETILGSNQVSEAVRLRIFKAYIESIFHYNSELWTLKKTLENTIDSFQRRILRKVIHVKWPRTINNQELYERTHMTPWSITISKRRLSWFGHLLRLPTETPAKEALQIYIKAAERPTGRPKTTWMSIVLNDINNHSEIKLTGDQNQDIDRLELICSDRMAWTKITARWLPSRRMCIDDDEHCIAIKSISVSNILFLFTRSRTSVTDYVYLRI